MTAGTAVGTVLELHPAMFGEAERLLVATPGIQVRSFRYASGVEALRLISRRVELVVLPFRGQQVWRYLVDGEDLTMRTHFSEPASSTVFGETYGGFLLHCGLSGIGAPGPSDSHAHHGELPNAAYPRAQLLLGAPDGVDAVGLTGGFRLRQSHTVDVEFRPTVRLPAEGTELDVEVALRNHRATPYEFSYLCHINWALPQTARLTQPVPSDPDHFTIAPHPLQDAATAAYTAAIEQDRAAGDLLSAAQPVVPEYCAVLRPVADSQGWAHFEMKRPDDRTARVSFETAELPFAIRWISNTGDEQAAGFCLPATGHHFGRAAAQADGLLRTLPGHGGLRIRMRVGLLDAAAAAVPDASA